MRKKGIFTLLTAACMVLAFSAVTFAANQVRLTTTVPNIPKSYCYQAGTDTLEFDTNTAIAEGDVMQFTLNNKVTVCKTINMWVQINAANSTVLETSASAPVSTTGGSISATGGSNKEWGFLIQATVGSQIVKGTLRVRDNVAGLLDPITASRLMTFTGLTAGDKLILKLFDGKYGFGNSLIYKQAAVPVTDTYFTALTAVTGPTENAICIDTLTQDYMDEYVQNTPDSLPVVDTHKLFFSGDYRIAHIMAQQNYSVVSCAAAKIGVPGHIRIGAQGQPDTCMSFDFESGAGTATSAYCTDHMAGNKLIIATSGVFDVTSYTVNMQIIVERDGVAKAIPGAYWSSAALTAGGYGTLALACAGDNGTSFGGAVMTYQTGAGSSASPRDTSAFSCDLTAAQKAVYLTTPASPLGIAAGQAYLYLNLPDFNYDPAEIAAGDVVKVKVTLTKVGCGVIGPLYITVGTFGCDATPTGTSACLFPYFTSVTGAGDFWNGIAIVNTSAVAGNATLTAYVKDGTTATATVPVAARSMYVDLVENFPWVGTPGNSQSYIQVTTTFPTVAGFAMMGQSSATGDSMGYLCK